MVGGLAGFLTAVATEIVKDRLDQKAGERERRRKAWEGSIDATRLHCRNMLDWILRDVKTGPIDDADELLLGDPELYEDWQTAVVECLRGENVGVRRVYQLRARADRALDDQMQRASRDEPPLRATVSARAAELGDERIRLGERAWAEASP